MLRADHLLLQPEWDRRPAYYQLAQEHGYGLEIISFALVSVLNDPSAVAKHLRAYKTEVAALSGVRTLHGPFIDIIPHSPDRLIADVARHRVSACLEIASELQASHVVFHTGLNWLIRNPGYVDRAAGAQGEFWAAMLEHFPA